MTSLMYTEARQAADCIAEQLIKEETLYRSLSAQLRQTPPQNIVTIARGSSDHAAQYLAYLIMLQLGQFVTSLPMSLITLHQAKLRSQGLLAIALSQSGRSPDLLEPIHYFRQNGANTVALVNRPESPLADTAEWAFNLYAGEERSVAATKSFLCTLSASARLVGYWSDNQALLQNLTQLPAALRLACEMDWSLAIETLLNAERIMVISRGLGLAVAQEAALKCKETCLIQAEAFSSAEVKHGPMALIDAGYPMLILAHNGPAQAQLIALASEMRQRGAKVLLAAPDHVKERNVPLVSCGCDELEPLLAIQSFYIMIEALARARGFDPDKPRHLNKVTTTL